MQYCAFFTLEEKDIVANPHMPHLMETNLWLPSLQTNADPFALEQRK